MKIKGRVGTINWQTWRVGLMAQDRRKIKFLAIKLMVSKKVLYMYWKVHISMCLYVFIYVYVYQISLLMYVYKLR